MMLKKIGKVIKYILTLGLVGSSNYSSYINNLKKYDKELDKKLLMEREKYINDENKVKEINKAIVENNIRFAIKIAKKYNNLYHTYEDIESTALYGLVKAVEKFDPKISLKFSTYKFKTIENEILMMFRKDNNYYYKVRSIDDINEKISNSYTKINNKVSGFDSYYKDKHLQNNNIDNYFEKEYKGELVKVLIGISHFYIDSKYRDIFNMLFLNKKKISQGQIAEVTNFSQSYTSRRIKLNNLDVYQGYKELENADNDSKSEMWKLYKDKGEEILDSYIEYDDSIKDNSNDSKEYGEIEI